MPRMKRPFDRAFATHEQQLLNKATNAAWIAVEHNYEDLRQYRVSQEFAINGLVRQFPIAILYKPSAFLLNSVRMCLL